MDRDLERTADRVLLLVVERVEVGDLNGVVEGAGEEVGAQGVGVMEGEREREGEGVWEEEGRGEEVTEGDSVWVRDRVARLEVVGEWQLVRVREVRGVTEYEREGEALGVPVAPRLMEPVAVAHLESVEVPALPSPESVGVSENEPEEVPL